MEEDVPTGQEEKVGVFFVRFGRPPPRRLYSSLTTMTDQWMMMTSHLALTNELDWFLLRSSPRYRFIRSHK